VAAPAAAGVATNGSALPEAMALLDDQRRLGRGDQLSFRVVEDRKEARRLVVTDSGELEVPYIGRVKGEGRTCRELAVEIKGLLEKEYYHQATVILAVDQLSASRGRVYLVGQVRMAGPQPIPTDEEFTVSKAILRAGGFSDFADRRRVKIMRKGEVDPAAGTLVVDVAAVLEKGRAEKDVVLRPDDLVFVPSRLVNF
jgi:protein involved in polysaccharide export with SLBB domain